MQLEPVMEPVAGRTALRDRLEELLKPGAAESVIRGYVPCEPRRVRSSPVRDRRNRFLVRAEVRMMDGARAAYAIKGYADSPDRGASATDGVPSEQLAEFYRSLSRYWLQRSERCPVIEPLGYCRDKGLLVLPWMYGVSLHEAIRMARVDSLRHAVTYASQALSRLHATDIVSEVPTTAEAMVRSTTQRWEQLYPRVPEARGLLMPLIDLLHAALPLLRPSAPTLVHGDAKPGHVLFNGRRWLLLDLDHYGYADPAYDVGSLLAWLEVECFLQPAFAAKAAQLVTTMENACVQANPNIALPNIAFFYGLTLICKVLPRLYQLPPAARGGQWSATVAHVALRARETLSAPLSLRTRIFQAERVSTGATDSDPDAAHSSATTESTTQAPTPEAPTQSTTPAPAPEAPPQSARPTPPPVAPPQPAMPAPLPVAPPQALTTAPPSTAIRALAPDETAVTLTAKRRGRPWLAVMLMSVMIGGTVAWYRNHGVQHADTYVAARVERGDVEDTVSAVGTLQPVEFVDVGTQVTGQLKTVHVTVGQHVTKGQLVAEIDPTLFASKVETTLASLENEKALLTEAQVQHQLAEQEYQRNQELYTKEAVSQEILQQSKAAVDQASAKMDALQAQIHQFAAQLKGDRANLAYTKIFAPISGTVVSLTSRVGQTLVATQQAPIIMRIADLNTMTVWAQVSEADVPKITLGMPVYFSTIGLPNRRWHSHVRQVLPTPENVNNVILYDVLFDVSNPDRVLQTGMSAQTSFEVAAARNVLVVPVAALAQRSSRGAAHSREAHPAAGAAEGQPKKRQYLVRVLEPDGRIEERPVKVGMMSRVSAEITSGLTEGENVIVGAEARVASAKNKSAPRPSVGGL